MYTHKLKAVAAALSLSLLVAMPFSAQAANEFFSIKICNDLNSWGGKHHGPLKHNIEYIITPEFAIGSYTKELTKSLAWDATGDASCGDAIAESKDISYPLTAQLKIVDQQTGVVLWNGKVTTVADNQITYSYQPNSVDDAGELVGFWYHGIQLSVTRSNI